MIVFGARRNHSSCKSKIIDEYDRFESYIRCTYALVKTTTLMKKITGLLLILFIVLGACSSPKPYYKTAKGKKKTKYYNEIQFGGKSASQMKKP